MNRISYMRDEHCNRNGDYINWTTMEWFKDGIPVGFIKDDGKRLWLYTYEHAGAYAGIIHKDTGYWYDADNNLLRIISKGPNSMNIWGDSSMEGGLDGNPNDSLLDFQGSIEEPNKEVDKGYNNLVNLEDFEDPEDSEYLEGLDKIKPKKTEPKKFVPYLYSKDTLKIFSKILGTINKDYSKTNAGNISLKGSGKLKDIFQKLGGFKNRAKTNEKDYTLNASKYDTYLNLDLGPEMDVNLLFNTISKVPVDIREKHINNFENLNNKEQSAIVLTNSWLTYMVNKMYLEYYSTNNEPLPAERISIPEHFVNEIYISQSPEELVSKIDKILNSYMDEDGRVYHNSYAKYFRNVKNILELAKRDKKDFETLLPRHGGQFDFKIEYPSTGYNLFDLVENGFIRSVRKDNFVNLTIVRDFVRDTIPNKYLENTEGQVEVYEHSEKDFDSYYDPLGQKTIVAKSKDVKLVDYASPFMENIVHANPTIDAISSDFIFENTKGKDIKADNQESPNWKDYNDEEKILLLVYQDALNDEAFKRYVGINRLFPGIIQLLLNNIDENYNKTEMYKMIAKKPKSEKTKREYDTVNKNLRIIIANRLKEIYDEYPDMACMLLALMNGDL